LQHAVLSDGMGIVVVAGRKAWLLDVGMNFHLCFEMQGWHAYQSKRSWSGRRDLGSCLTGSV